MYAKGLDMTVGQRPQLDLVFCNLGRASPRRHGVKYSCLLIQTPLPSRMFADHQRRL